jgi:hypothetical protein
MRSFWASADGSGATSCGNSDICDKGARAAASCGFPCCNPSAIDCYTGVGKVGARGNVAACRKSVVTEKSAEMPKFLPGVAYVAVVATRSPCGDRESQRSTRLIECTPRLWANSEPGCLTGSDLTNPIFSRDAGIPRYTLSKGKPRIWREIEQGLFGARLRARIDDRFDIRPGLPIGPVEIPSDGWCG